MKKLLMFFIAIVIANMTFAQVTVTGCTGAGNGSYSTLSAAATAIVAAQPSANIVITITGNTTEPAITGATSMTFVAGTWSTLTIEPSGGSWIISGAATAGYPLITFNGSDNVTINGGGNLTIANTTVSATSGTSTLKLIGDATNNTFNNVMFKGSSTAGNGTNAAILWISTGTTTGNDGNSFQSCKFTAAGSNLPGQCVIANGSTTSTAVENSGITFNNCEFYDYFQAAVGSSAIYAATGNTNWTITNNKIYQTATRTITASSTVYGIYAVNTGSTALGEGFTITGNTIGYNNNSGTGTMTYAAGATAGGFYGILCSTSATSTSTNNINYNTISNIQWTSTSSSVFYGISSATANTGVGAVLNFNNNTIKNIASITATGAIYGINAGYAPTTYINSNNIYTISRTGASTLYGINYTGISATNVTLDFNTIYSLSSNSVTNTSAFNVIYTGSSPGIETITNNTIYDISSTATGAQTISGIYNNSTTGNKKIQNNTLYNFSLPAAGTGTIYGIRKAYGGTTDLVSGNTVYSLTGGTSIYGINSAAGTTVNIYKNKIYGLSSSVASPLVYGLNISSGTTVNVYNNLIGNLTTPSANLAEAIRGISIVSTTTATNYNVYYNTVYINATSTGTNFGTTGIYHAASSTATTATLNLRNNIIVNTSTPYGTGYTVAFRRSAGTANMLANYASTSNNNLFYTTPSTLGYYLYYDGTSNAQTIADYKAGAFTAGTIAPRDAVSVSEIPTWVSTTGNDATYLHIDPNASTGIESGAATIASFDTDFDGDYRFGNASYTAQNNGGGAAPDMGADEFDGTPSYTCESPTPGAAIASVSSICFGQSINLSLETVTAGTGVTYQWQKSTDGSSYSDISGAIGSTYTASPTEETFYICNVTCKKDNSEKATDPAAHITFAYNITSTTPGNRCGTGSVNLQATGDASTVAWYAAATGGTSLGTGSPWATPSIASTTTYYVGAETSTPVNATIGLGAITSSSVGYSFFPGGWGGAKTQYIIKASELISAGLSAGNFNSIGFKLTTSGQTYQGFFVNIGQTNEVVASPTTFISAGLTQVYAGTLTDNGFLPIANSINTLAFGTGSGSSPTFIWDGTSNIVISFSWSLVPSAATSTGSTMEYDNVGFTSTSSRQRDSYTPSAMLGETSVNATTTFRPKFIIDGISVCSSPRTAVIATVNTAAALTLTANQTVCNNAVATLSVTSNHSDYDTYIWSPAANLYTDLACNNAYDGVSSATTLYAKTATAGAYTYTCSANNSVNSCSNITTSTVTVLPLPTIASSQATLCISGISDLTTTPATGYGAATFQWLSSSNSNPYSDISGANTINYTTPTIANTTSYKLQIKLDGNVCNESNEVTVTVNNPQVITTTPANRCGIGTVTLEATASVGATLNWYAAASGGTSLGTGNSFITPIVSGTTSYYVSASNIGSASLTTIGSGVATTTPSSTAYNPFDGTYGGIKTQHLYTAAELLSAGINAGTITSIALNVASIGTTYNGFYIQIGNTALTNFATANIEGGLTTVYNVASVTPTVGINTYTFATPFVWDGVSNIIVSMSWSNATTSNTPSNVKADPTSNYSSQSYRKDSDTPANILAYTGTTGTTTTSSSMNRPQIKFGYIPSCSNSRTEVVATVTSASALTVTADQSVCNNTVATLSVTSNLSDFDSYVWSPATNLYTDMACLDAYDGVSSHQTVYAKTATAGAYTYTCNSNDLTTLCSNSTTSVVTVLQAAPVITAVTPVICGANGSSVINAVPATGFGTATLQWQTSTDGISYSDIVDEISTSYTTPTLTSLNYYKLQVKNGASVCSESNSVSVAINPIPNVVVTPNSGSYCGSGNVPLIASGADAYTWSPTNGLDVSTGAIVNANPASTTTYTVSGTANGCTGTKTVTVTVNAVPSAVTVTPASHTMCETADAVQLVATGGTISNVVILNENFNGVTNSWTTTNTSTGGTPASAEWTLRADAYSYGSYSPVTFHSNDNSQFYLSNSDAQGNGGTTATTLRSPSFSTLGFTSATINFYHYYYHFSGSTAKVEVSTDGNVWTTLQTYSTTTGNATTFATANVSLTAPFLNQATVYMRFKYDGVYAYYWSIDNVVISGNGQANTTWFPLNAGLYTDASATTAYAGEALTTVYAKPLAGNHTYTAKATSDAGCFSSNTASVAVNPILPVSVSISTPLTTVNVGTSVTFTATPTNGGTVPTYQWYVNGSAVGTGLDTYTYIPNNGDAVSCMLTSDLVTCVTGNPAMSNGITMSINAPSAVTRTWVGASNNIWANAANWSNGVPAIIDNVVIPATATNFPTLTSGVTIHNITIESNASGTGSLLDGGFLNLTGTATVKQYVVSDQWHYISSPVSSATTNVFSPALNSNIPIYIRNWNQTSQSWEDIINLTTNLTVGKGYAIWATASSPTIVYNGSLNNTSSISYGTGWNFVANPFVSALDWNAITGKPLNNAFYCWNNLVYYISDGQNQVNLPAGALPNIIPAMQGFFIKGDAANVLGGLSGARVHNNHPIYKSNGTINDKVRLTAQKGNFKDEALLVFNPAATNNYDESYDASKLFSYNNNVPEIYTLAANNQIAINQFGTIPVAIPLNIHMGVADNVTITASEFANFDANVNITLEDMLIGGIQDLRQNSSYTFAASVGENANRFVLHFATASGINEPTAGNISIYANENNIYVNTTEKVKEISVYNMLGQVITTVSGNAKSLNTINMNNATGNYVVKVTTEKGVRTEKVFVK